MQQNLNKRNHHLAYCKICHYRDYDNSKGITCVLTKAIANFENECPSMQLDFEALEGIQIDIQNEIVTLVKKNYLLKYIKKQYYFKPNYPYKANYHSKENTHGLKIKTSREGSVWTILSFLGFIILLSIGFNAETYFYKVLSNFLAVLAFIFLLIRLMIDYYTPKKILLTTDEFGVTIREKRFFWHDIVDYRVLYRSGDEKGYFQLILGTINEGVQTIDLTNVDITKAQLLEILKLNRKDYLTRYERNLPDVF
ncbi:hypothetical protein KORDIASMS9_04332 [Kordia sp. SMS9]|uniref:hypothetical protein n=1 Tax=Kordia sp. SMS9 TaxID=2282170 RepID=UPI000E0D7FC3|nr:hypothetical protein [Kordia sp. SMS9]AXG72070.1 hypothetical protein KORDIASMS9_04332 [Kordia sp. SMS9]